MPRPAASGALGARLAAITSEAAKRRGISLVRQRFLIVRTPLSIGNLGSSTAKSTHLITRWISLHFLTEHHLSGQRSSPLGENSHPVPHDPDQRPAVRDQFTSSW